MNSAPPPPPPSACTWSVPAGPGLLQRRLIRSSVAATALVLASGCVDNRVVEPELEVGPGIVPALALDPSHPGVLLDPRPPVPERIGEIRLPDGIVERLAQPSDSDLNEAVETSGETASGGVKVYVGDGSQECPA